MVKKLTLEQMIEKVDAAKKANPLDLSSDQDLTIALMNLISLEEHFFFSGAKTEKTGFYDLINTVREMRKELMQNIVKNDNGEVWCISKHLLAASMRVMEVGTKAIGAGKKEDAYSLFNKAYDLYSLFWGLNMELIDITGVKKVASETYNSTISEAFHVKETEEKLEKSSNTEHKSTVKRLGEWVKNAVNCCIE
ncbi:MAG: hypothetical protein JW974_00610 [Alphaproteobacteria bacterium]|nr:hypothetical protein [Alphaproteobacteria bacterium]MBN2675250.1 hypothetical protein [Alphaproteobacteria bacterium]